MFPISHWSITNNDWDRIGIGSLEEQNSSLHNQIHVNIMNTRPKAIYFKKEREKNLKFPQEWQEQWLGILDMNT